MAAGNSAKRETHRGYRFGPFTLDIDRAALYERGEPVRLRRQSFDVLRYLVEHQGRVVEKHELMKAIWANTAVTDDSLTHCLIDIRKAIGDTQRELVRTVPRRGYVFDVPVEHLSSPDDTASPLRGIPRPLLYALLVVLALGAAFWLSSEPGDSTGVVSAVDTHEISANSIAVLPFADMSENQDYAYFADGLAEEILNSLARYSGLRVIARTSSFTYREPEHDVTTIARELGVANVLEGSVRVEGGQARITAQLVSGADGMHLWSDTFDRELDDVLGLQSDVANAVSRVLAGTLQGDVSRTEEHLDSAAYDYYLQARFLSHRRAKGDIAAARDYYRKAIDIEPEFARAWAGLAGVHVVQYGDSGGSDRARLGQVKAAAERAVAIDPRLAEGWVRLGMYYKFSGDREAADRHLDRAIAAGPDDPLVLAVAAGRFAAGGELERAIAYQRRALELNPLSAIDRGNLSFFLYASGRYEEAIRENRRAQRIHADPTNPTSTIAGYSLIQLGRYREALEEVERWPDGPDRDSATAMARLALGQKWRARQPLRRLQNRTGIEAYLRLAELRAFCEETDRAFEVLAGIRDELVRTQSASTFALALYNDLRWSPFLASIRPDPRWQPWLTEVRELTVGSISKTKTSLRSSDREHGSDPRE